MMPNQARTTIQKARKAWGRPVSSCLELDGGTPVTCCATGEFYCVGGALGRVQRSVWQRIKWLWKIDSAEDSQMTFPDVDTLAATLLEFNEDLTPQKAYEFAINIIEANDRDEFDNAWQISEEALCYPFKPEGIERGGSTEDCSREGARELQGAC